MGRFLRTDTNSGGHSRLGRPIVVNAAQGAQGGIGIQLAFQHRRFRRAANTSFLRPAIIPASSVAYEPIAGYLTRPRDRSPGVHSFLRAPLPATPKIVYPGIRVELTYSRRGKATSTLHPPAVVGGGIAYEPIRGYLAPPRDRNPRTISRLRAPTGTPAIVVAYSGPKVNLVRSRRGTAHPFLRAPVVVSAPSLARPPIVRLAASSRGKAKSFLRPMGPPAIVYAPLEVKLTYSRRGVAKPNLSPPTVVAPVLARPVKIELAYSRRGRPKSKLAPPTVLRVFTAPPLRTTLVEIRPPRVGYRLAPPGIIDPAPALVVARSVNLAAARRRPRTMSHLFGVVVSSTSVVYEPIRGHLTRPLDRVPKTRSRLAPPIFTPSAVVYYGPEVHLAPSRRGRPKSRLSRPVVVGPVLARPTLVHLTYSTRGKAKPHLSPPTVVAPVLARPIRVSLARIRPAAVHSILRRPTDLVDAADLGFVRVHLAYSRRGRPKSKLGPPVVVAPVLAAPIKVALTRVRPAAVHSILRRPTDLVDAADLGSVRIHLAYGLRGRAKSKLSPPAVITAQGAVATSIKVTLVRARPVKTHPFLRAPVVVTAATPYLRPIDVTLAYQSRGKAKSKLASVVYPVVAATSRPVAVHLTRIRPPRMIWRLGEPTVVREATLARAILVHLAYSRRGKALSGLGRPIVLDTNTAYPQGPMVQLAPQRRGAPKSKLRQPIAIQAVVFYPRPIEVTLVRSRRPAVHSILRKPTDLVDQQDIGSVGVHLAYSRRGKAKYRLAPPTVVFLAVEIYGPETTLVRIRPPRTMWNLGPMGPAAVVYAPVSVNLTYSRRGTPKSNLPQASPYTPIAQGDFTILVHLTYSRRGKAKSKLRLPVVVRAATPYFRREPVTLAYQSRGRPKSNLGPPVVVNERPIFFFGPTTLAPIPRRKTRSFLRPPVKVFSFIARPEQITLAPQSRGVPKSILRPPTVVRVPSAGTLSVHLAYSLRGRPKSILRKPVVVGAGIAFYGPTVTLVRIRPPKTHWRLLPPTAIIIEVCYGDPMCGFDFAAEVCGSDEAATAIGTTATGSNVSGSDVGATVEGASAARGSVTGDDARREGC